MHTLAQAAQVTGKNRSTLLRAIKTGKLSAHKQDDGSYLIDSSELFRVYDAQGALVQMHKHAQATHNPAQGTQNELIEALREQIELLRDQVIREQEQADHWRNQATMLLTHQPETPKAEPDSPVKSRLFEKLFGKRNY
jgi:uncharacterized protein involved in type VI secretion and phage assembly